MLNKYFSQHTGERMDQLWKYGNYFAKQAVLTPIYYTV